MAEVLLGLPIGFLLWFVVRYGALGFYTVGPNERAVLTTFGRAQRLGASTLEDPIAQTLRFTFRESLIPQSVAAAMSQCSKAESNCPCFSGL